MIAEKLIAYILDRLQETSTIRGLIYFFGSLLGIAITPETANSIIYLILGFAGMVSVLLPDKFKNKTLPHEDSNEVSNSPELPNDSENSSQSFPYSKTDKISSRTEEVNTYPIDCKPSSPNKSARVFRKDTPISSTDNMQSSSKSRGSEESNSPWDSGWDSGFNDK